VNGWDDYINAVYLAVCTLKCFRAGGLRIGRTIVHGSKYTGILHDCSDCGLRIGRTTPWLEIHGHYACSDCGLGIGRTTVHGSTSKGILHVVIVALESGVRLLPWLKIHGDSACSDCGLRIGRTNAHGSKSTGILHVVIVKSNDAFSSYNNIFMQQNCSQNLQLLQLY
jgi:predicted RNA-binding Zn-ribbon protein involved in translation (DUF1610 family)